MFRVFSAIVLIYGVLAAAAPALARQASVGPVRAASVSADGILPPVTSLSEMNPAGRESPQDLYLEIVNGDRSTGEVVHVRSTNGRLMMQANAMHAAALVVPRDLDNGNSDAWIPLDALPGLAYRYEAATQRLVLQVPPALRPVQRLGYRPPPTVEVRRDWGALASYDAYGRELGGSGTLSVANRLRWFGPFGAVEATGISRANSGARATYRRLDTRWTYSDPRQLWTWTAGDLIAGGLTWSRPVRIAGVQWRRNFDLRPDLISVPMTRFSGDATLPSSVELYVNSVRQFRADVQDGPFVVDAVPRIAGAGQATVVVTDTLGRVTETSFPLYVDYQRLARGLTDFSVEAGVLRLGYGSTSDAYGRDLVASASVRRGVTSTLTLEAHGEGRRDLWLTGAGAIWAPANRWGVLATSYARGTAAGAQYSAGYQWAFRGYGFDVQRVRRNTGFRDLGDPADPSADSPPRQWLPSAVRVQDRATVWVPLRSGSLSLNWLSWRGTDERREWTRSVSWTQTIDRRLSVSASLFDDRAGGIGGGLTMTVPIGRQTYASASVRQNAGRVSTSADVRQTAPYGGGWGWNVQGSSGPGGYAQAAAEVRGQRGEAQFGVDRAADRMGAFFQGSGSLAMMAGHVFLSRRIDDAFAVVSTNDRSGVPVMSEHRPFGRTSADGYLLVPGLRGWQRNNLAIDPEGLDPDYRLGSLQQTATPADRSGVLVRFDITRIHPVLVTLLGPDGEPLRAGSRGRLFGTSRPVLVGFDGESYIEDLPDDAVIEMDVNGGRCRYRVRAASSDGAQRKSGPLTCEWVQL